MTASATVALDKLRTDLQQYAHLAEVRYDPVVVDPVLDTLADLWANSVVGVRTTTHPVHEREVNARVMHPGDPTDLIERLRAAGLLTYTGHPMEQLLAEISAAVPVRSGVDLALAGGVQKIWLVFPELIGVERILGFSGMPESARAHAAHLSRYGGRIGILAVDFDARTMNLYSNVFEPGHLAPADIAEILAELDFTAATDDELALLGRTFNLYRTFSWSEPGMRRICFPVRCEPSSFPTHLDPVLARFVDGAPFADPDTRGFVFYAAYGPNDRYFKVQAEYAAARQATFPGGTAPRTT
ncbi:aromatic prenyltransferase [Nocardia sp. NBC_00565]|uniref:aromatic prenyltransferase n=1 Tax=Nocardia sp. NBC_00565 TaxID=2975993 RepID=UPI002E8237DA|nr:aromatic prenyltransferase [Nocardia sp. NBC_00565]WUC04876.1 aromatic prenyltransferase [Nocardia sp. NBC_00565]